MGPKNREELEIWTRFACAAMADPNRAPDYHADWTLDQWRKRRDAVDAAERERRERREAEAEERAVREREQRIAEAEASKALVRAALNAAPWESNCDNNRLWTRRAMCGCDEADTGRGIFWLHGHGSESNGVWSLDWPEGFGSPPPGWGGEVAQ